MIPPSAEKIPAPVPSPADLEEGTSLWVDAWHRLRKNHLSVFGGAVIVILSFVCLVVPFLITNTYQEQNLELGPTSPSWSGPLPSL